MSIIIVIVSLLLSLVKAEEISRHEFLTDELDHKLQLLKHDIQSIEKFVHTNLLYQEDNVENSTELGEEYEDYQPGENLAEEDYNFEYEEYDYGSTGAGPVEGSESVEVSATESSGSEELATETPTISDLMARYLKRGKQDKGKGNKGKGKVKKAVAKKGKKVKKVKKAQKEKKVKKGKKKQKKQKGLSAGDGDDGDDDIDQTPKLTRGQIRRLCNSQRRRGGEDGLRGINEGGQSNSNRFAQQFQQLTESFNQLQAALEAARKTSPIPIPSGSTAGQAGATVDRGSAVDQESGVGPLVQAAIGAQSAAANALRGLLPSGQ